jgi:hypothetical protein
MASQGTTSAISGDGGDGVEVIGGGPYYDTKVNEIIMMKPDEIIEIGVYKFTLKNIEYFGQELMDRVREIGESSNEQTLAIEYMKDLDHKICLLQLKMVDEDINLEFRRITYRTGFDNWCWYLYHDKNITNYDELVNIEYGSSSTITSQNNNSFGFDSMHRDVFTLKSLTSTPSSILLDYFTSLEPISVDIFGRQNKHVINLSNLLKFFTTKYGDTQKTMIDRVLVFEKRE